VEGGRCGQRSGLEVPSRQFGRILDKVLVSEKLTFNMTIWRHLP
jgi:hypothetical protein